MPDIVPPVDTYTINGNTYTNNDWEADAQGAISGTAADMAAVVAAFSIPLYAATPPLDLFVEKTGSDLEDGLEEGDPCLTIAHALVTAFKHHANGGNIIIHIGDGDWAEDVFINGPLNGSANDEPIPNIGTVWSSMIVLSGNGKTLTTISGSGNVCATVCSSQHAVVGIEEIKISGGKISCQSPIFAQMGGIIHLFGGVEIGAAGATSEQIHAENAGSSIQIWENLTMSGGGSIGIGVSDQAEVVQGAGLITISGTPAYDTAFLYVRGGRYQSNVAVPFSGAGVTGNRFIVISNGTIETSGELSTTLIPGNALGVESSGGIYHGPLPSTLGTGGSVATGIGTTGTATISGGSRFGVITLTPGGTGISSTGNFTIDFPSRVLIANGIGGPVVYQLGAGTGTWNSRAVTQSSGRSESAINGLWDNNSVALTTGLTYFIYYMVGGDF